MSVKNIANFRPKVISDQIQIVEAISTSLKTSSQPGENIWNRFLKGAGIPSGFLYEKAQNIPHQI